MRVARFSALLPLLLRDVLLCLAETRNPGGMVIEFGGDEEETATTPPVTRGRGPAASARPGFRPCDYDLCAYQDVSCYDLSVRTGCLCPGITGPMEPPQPPQIKSVAQGAPGMVSVQWCAPLSTVDQYRVTVQGRGEQRLAAGGRSRNRTVEGVRAGDRVCVEAVNGAGSSGFADASCAVFDPSPPRSAGVAAGVIAGGLGLLVLISVVAISLWKRKFCHQTRTENVEGLGNPSFSKDSSQE
ncbi:LRRN4 C-terminal-like protein [Denticeps clupeoides]|uniref:LRRN4 C-terminal-like protein n=1 Tax=Denticeps clupeoides TaxID=299321 RepID=A0AAY4CKI9_9TELE|nr:LRRN4 C-terminal-like protein [Denticeps clupeoides]